MFRSRFRMARALQITVAWVGLLLMIASFAWLQWTSKSKAPPTSTRAPARYGARASAESSPR